MFIITMIKLQFLLKRKKEKINVDFNIIISTAMVNLLTFPLFTLEQKLEKQTDKKNKMNTD